MMFLQTAGGGAVALHIDDYCVKELASGLDELQFTISIFDPEYKLIQEQTQIREESEGTALYTVQAIDGGGDTATVKAVLDLSDWESTMLLDYDAGEVFPGVVVNAVKPSGWTLHDYSGILYTRPISMDGGTPLDLLEQLRDEFDGLTYRFDNVQKVVTVVDMYKGPNAGGPDAVGTYLTRELNLKSIEYKGKSTELYTRLYVVGADGLTFASINGGKAYVEDFSYTTRVICKYVNDSRFTDAANMLAWAQEYVQQLAVPVRSYEVDVADLARAVPDKYGFLSFPLYTKILLIDETRPAARVFVRVAAVWRYPGRPEKNRVMLSTIAPRVQTQVKEALKPITAQRMGAGAVSKRALSAPLKDEMKDTADTAAEANTKATTAKNTADNAKDRADAAYSLASTAKDTADNAATAAADANTLAATANSTANTAKDESDANTEKLSNFGFTATSVSIQKNLSVSGPVVAASFYDNQAIDVDNRLTNKAHTHYVTVDSATGQITLGDADLSGGSHPFNVADTQYFQNRMSAITTTAITAARETADANIRWDASTHTLTADYNLAAKNAAGATVYTELEYPITIPADKAYQAGYADGGGGGTHAVTFGTLSYAVGTDLFKLPASCGDSTNTFNMTPSLEWDGVTANERTGTGANTHIIAYRYVDLNGVASKNFGVDVDCGHIYTEGYNRGEAIGWSNGEASVSVNRLNNWNSTYNYCEVRLSNGRIYQIQSNGTIREIV